MVKNLSHSVIGHRTHSLSFLTHMIDVNAHLDWVGFAEQYKFSHHLSLESDNLRFSNVVNFVHLCKVSTTPIMNPMSTNTGLATQPFK